MTTAKDLILYLQQFSDEATVGILYQCCSDYDALDLNKIRYYPKEKDIGRRWVIRNGQLMEYDEKVWDPAETPQFVSLIVFPGN